MPQDCCCSKMGLGVGSGCCSSVSLSCQHSVVRNALFCLEMAAEKEESHVYTKALLAYTFALAGKEEKRKALLGSLEKEAVRKGECCRWALLFTGLTSSLAKMAFVVHWLQETASVGRWGKVRKGKSLPRGLAFLRTSS